MQKLRVYTIQDKKVGYNNQLMLFQNDDVAVRSFDVVVNQKDTIYNSHPEDFFLMYLGDFDTETGYFTAEAGSTLIVSATELIKEV